MDSSTVDSHATMMAAWIGGAATVLAALISSVVTWRVQARQAERKRKETEDAALEIAKGSVKAAPYFLDGTETTLQFDVNGTGEQVKQYNRVRATQSIDNFTIPFGFRVACPGGKVLAPTGKELPGSKNTVSLIDLSVSELAVRGKAQINGLFSPQTGPVSFYIRHPFEKGICVSRKQAEEAYKNDKSKLEYAASLTSVPMESLAVKVVFPPNHRNLDPPPAALAFLGETEQLHVGETERIRNELAYVGGVATLTVPRPSPGIQYAIAWMPPEL